MDTSNKSERKKALDEIGRRRTFGIISHPDAGKTTLTEKLLLFGGAIQMAGAIRARKASRHAASDWMAIEQERGISVNSSVMKFHYENFEINLIDTPGHHDFSEDTYRVLTAVDSAIMVIDSVKGVETQTKKLMEICRLRNTPIITFINKLDREGMSPLEIMSDIEDKLQIECTPLSWPIGMGKNFRGTWSIHKSELNLFKPGQARKSDDMIKIVGLGDPALDKYLKDQAQDLRDDIDLLEGAANPFDMDHFSRGNQTPVFFGSAINNFGVQELLNSFVEIAPAPKGRETTTRIVEPQEEAFSGFVFKIQANMDPQHRDRIAFFRICSGHFEKGMKARHHRLDKDMLISNPIMFLAQDRKAVEEAWPGDIIGIHNHGTLKIGDTLSEKEPLKFIGIPNFAPEHFRRIMLKNALKAKQLQKGLTQLAEEGAIQIFRPIARTEYILGAVGILQFDVAIARLKAEYGVDAQFESVEYTTARWLKCHDPKKLAAFQQEYQNDIALDGGDNLAYLAPNEYRLKFVLEDWKDIVFQKVLEQN